MPLDWMTKRNRAAAPVAFEPDYKAMEREFGPVPDNWNVPYAPRPRDLDDLFAMGLRIAEDVIRWEEAAGGQSITVLIEHIKGTRKLRDTIEQGANGKEERAA